MPPRRLKKDGTPYKHRRGWGPYRSVPNERSVAFNLQLDVQNLQQEVRNLLALRDILQTKALIQRHSPEGSLCKLVNEYLFVFRKGVVPQVAGPRRLVEERHQRAFMHSVMDPEVDLGPGLPRGPDVIMDQMANYSNFLRFISLTGVVDSIVVADESVLISDAASFVFQVTRSTIELIFPHIIGNEWLVAQLVGQQVEAQGRSTFHFNTAGKCFQYDVEMDFVGAFMSVVKDPRIVDILLGRALITQNGMIGIMNEPYESEVEDDEDDEDEEKAPATLTNTTASGGGGRNCSGGQNATHSRSEEFCRKVVSDYFTVFANGYRGDGSAETPAEVSLRDFFAHRFGAPKEVGTNATLDYVKERWHALSECFEFLKFQQKGVTKMDCADDNCMCLVESEARYVLRITSVTIQSVFPHVVSNTPLLNTLMGKVIVVPSHLLFSIEKNMGYLLRISERMDFSAAMAEILSDEDELSFVVSQAFLVEDGVGYGKPTYSSSVRTPALLEQQTQLPSLNQPRKRSGDDSRSGQRKITMVDLLS